VCCQNYIYVLLLFWSFQIGIWSPIATRLVLLVHVHTVGAAFSKKPKAPCWMKFLDQESIGSPITVCLVLVLLVLSTSLKKLNSVVSNRIRMKSGNIVPQVNMLRLKVSFFCIRSLRRHTCRMTAKTSFYKAPLFQNGSGWNLAGMFPTYMCIDWWSWIFDLASKFQDGGHDVFYVEKCCAVLPPGEWKWNLFNVLCSDCLRFWPVIDNALRKASLERGVQVRVLASLWNHTKHDMVYFLRSLTDITGAMKADIQVVSVASWLAVVWNIV